MEILLLISYAVIFADVYLYLPRFSDRLDWRAVLLLSLSLWSGLLVVITEVLSLRNLVHKSGLVTAWGIVIAGGMFLLVFRFHSQPWLPDVKKWRFSREFIFRKMEPSVFVLLLLILLQLSILLGIALNYPPNNWDSMTYHMARVVHWQQEKSVAHYATNIERQIRLQPFAEFVILHLQILSGGDQYANLVQWSAMVAAGIGVSKIAAYLGGGLTNQLWAMALCYSLPMGVLQSSSTQNDYVLSAWLVTFVTMGLAFKKAPNTRWTALATGLSLGLALLTKATAYIYAFPFCVYIGISSLKSLNKKVLGNLLLLVFVTFGLNAGHYTRNLGLYGNPLGPQDGYVNEFHSIGALTSNMIRNATLHVTIPFVSSYNQFILEQLEKLHHITGLQTADSGLSYVISNPFIEQPMFNEDYSGNPFHFILILIWLGICLIRCLRYFVYKVRRIEPSYPIQEFFYGTLLLSGFILFCGYLKWQPWNSRLHLPLFVLWSPALSISLLRPEKKLSGYTALLFLLVSFMWITYNVKRPLIDIHLIKQSPRTHYYFTMRQELILDYEEVSGDIRTRNCHQIGLDIGGDTWEYPFWAMFLAEDYPVEMRHIQVGSPSKVFLKSDFLPCAIISEYPKNFYGTAYSPKLYGHYVVHYLVE